LQVRYHPVDDLLLGDEQVAQLLGSVHHLLRGCSCPARLAWTGVDFADSSLTQSHALWNRPRQVDFMNVFLFFVRLREKKTREKRTSS
jgi:hypothetical protein